MQAIWNWGIEIILALQAFDGLAVPMNLVTFTGSTEFFLLILPALYWLVNRRLGVQMAVMLLISILLGSVLKLALHGPRPYWIEPQVQLLGGAESTFGLPSIHSLNAVVMWALLAQYLQRSWAWLGAIVLALLAGVARMYLGVHFPSDVIIGWLLGIVLLRLWWRWQEPVTVWFGQFSLVQQILLGGILSMLFILDGVVAQFIGAMTMSRVMVWPPDVSMGIEQFMHAFALSDIMTVAGVLCGLIAGALLCTHWGGFVERAALGRQIGRYLVGVIGVLLLWQGLDLLFSQLATDESTLDYALRYIRYALVGFWIFGLAPLLFIRVRLADRPTNS